MKVLSGVKYEGRDGGEYQPQRISVEGWQATEKSIHEGFHSVLDSPRHPRIRQGTVAGGTAGNRVEVRRERRYAEAKRKTNQRRAVAAAWGGTVP